MKTRSLTVCKCGYAANHLLPHTAERRVHGSAVNCYHGITPTAACTVSLSPTTARAAPGTCLRKTRRIGGDPAQGSCAGQRVQRGTSPRCTARRRAYRACCFAVLHHHGVVETCSTSNQAWNAGAAAASCVKKDVPRARSVRGRTLTRLLPWTKYVSELLRERLVCSREASETTRAYRACSSPWCEASRAVTRPKDHQLTRERRVSKRRRSDTKRGKKLELLAARRKPRHAGHRSALLIAWRDQCMLGFERQVIC